MATVSLSPTPGPLSAMSTRRTPLTSNPNVANSPLRGASALAQANKQKRSHANIQREELYGQPPPLKRQMLENGAQRQLRSPSKTYRNTSLPQRSTRSAVTKDKGPVPQQQHQSHSNDSNIERIRQWQNEYHARFPKMVFYFESISEDLRAKLSKQATSLGAREERFFSNNITHVVTTRPIPTGQEDVQTEVHDEAAPDEQPQTINPSLLDRSTDTRRRLFENNFRKVHAPLDDSARRPKITRNNNDILHKARNMGKKIWTLEKFQRILDFLLEPDPYVMAHGGKPETSRHGGGARRNPDETNLSQLLQHERVNGPSDRDPTVASRELIHFKGPHIYVYDIEEKQKPIMVREYPKVSSKYEGEWPQFRTVTDGRCPFVEEPEPGRASRKPKEQEKERPAKPVVESRPTLQPQAPALKTVIGGKRSLSEMHDGQNQGRAGLKPMEMLNASKAIASKQIDFRPQAGFTSRAPPGRLFGGEPVASGVQPSNITSAIRSQMVSSASGIGTAKAGTSKEVHGLQRKVLQRSANSQDPSSRRPDVSMDVASSRSTGIGRTGSRRMELIGEDAEKGDSKHSRASSKSQPVPPPKTKRELKPGYCENCQDKFRDFDEHILSRKHRKFAENDDNWGELDYLLGRLGRPPKFSSTGRVMSLSHDNINDGR